MSDPYRLQLPRRRIENPSTIDEAICTVLDEVFYTIGMDQQTNFDTLVDDPKVRGLVRRVAMNAGWPLPHRNAPVVSAKDKEYVLALLHKIINRLAKRETVDLITPGPVTPEGAQVKSLFLGQGGPDGAATVPVETASADQVPTK